MGHDREFSGEERGNITGSVPALAQLTVPDPPRAPRWHLLYFALAAVDLVTVGLSLGLSHQLRGSFERAVTTNSAWAERLGRYSELQTAATLVNAPGNEVFQSKDPDGEEGRLTANWSRFEALRAHAIDELDRAPDPESVQGIRTQLVQLGARVGEIVAESKTILNHVRNDQYGPASESMASMDRIFAIATSELARLGSDVRHIQSSIFAEQRAGVVRLARFEVLIGCLIFMMVGGVTIYGHRLARHARLRHAEQRQSYLALAQASERAESDHRRLLDLSRQAGMAEVSAGVLHNVGNVLNSVGVSIASLRENLARTKAGGVGKLAAVLASDAAKEPRFLIDDARGKQIPAYLASLASALAEEESRARQELDTLQRSLTHIKSVVRGQQGLARSAQVIEQVYLHDLIEDALRLSGVDLDRRRIRLIREYDPNLRLTVDRQLLLQILVNLIRNAVQAMGAPEVRIKTLTIREQTSGEGQLRLEIADTGMGIAADHLPQLFVQGFTTKKDGNGFGLHSSALAAQALNGTLSAESEGPGRGARFRLEIPIQAREEIHEPTSVGS